MQKLRTHLATILLPLALAGCMTAWPQAGTGGMAERGAVVSQPIAAHKGALDRLYGAGGRSLAAAEVELSEVLLIKAQRLEAAGLCEDANVALAEMRVELRRGEGRTRLTPSFFKPEEERVTCK